MLNSVLLRDSTHFPRHLRQRKNLRAAILIFSLCLSQQTSEKNIPEQPTRIIFLWKICQVILLEVLFLSWWDTTGTNKSANIQHINNLGVCWRVLTCSDSITRGNKITGGTEHGMLPKARASHFPPKQLELKVSPGEFMSKSWLLLSCTLTIPRKKSSRKKLQGKKHDMHHIHHLKLPPVNDYLPMGIFPSVFGVFFGSQVPSWTWPPNLLSFSKAVRSNSSAMALLRFLSFSKKYRMHRRFLGKNPLETWHALKKMTGIYPKSLGSKQQTVFNDQLGVSVCVSLKNCYEVIQLEVNQEPVSNIRSQTDLKHL